MIYTSGSLPTIAAQLIDYQRAIAAQPPSSDDLRAKGRAKGAETSAANGKRRRKEIIRLTKKLGAADADTLAAKTGLCKESIRRYCSDLVNDGALKINPTRPVSWSPKAPK